MPQFSEFAALQEKLGPALAMNRPNSGAEHVLLVLPSFSIGETVLSHYGPRVPALEHRYLNAVLILARIASCHMIYVCSKAPLPEVVDAYFNMMTPAVRDHARRRFTLLIIPDQSYRPVATKLIEDPVLLETVRQAIAGRAAFIEPWNVTENEVNLALALDVPINGCDPILWPLGFKSAGRKLMRESGVPVPLGVEDVTSIGAVLDAIATIRAAKPNCAGVVVKHDNSVAGDGNAVLRFAGGDAAWRAKLDSLPEWYVSDLIKGGIVEELVSGRDFSSPSVQVDVQPGRIVNVLATHEQMLGGEDGQVYMGCRFPAHPGYAPQLANYGDAIGRQLAAAGFIGRFSVDFAVVQDELGMWQVHALEMNLRKGGTTHPYVALRHLVPGRYDFATGRWVCDDNTERCYVSTDNLVDASWLGLDPVRLLGELGHHDLLFNSTRRTGIVPHMLACLAVDGRYGVTAIGTSPRHAQDLFERTRAVTAAAATRRFGRCGDRPCLLP